MTRKLARRLVVGLVAGVAVGLVAVAPAPAFGQACIAPTLRSINIDGDLSDWAEVLANPDNTSRDGDGSTVSCGVSTDLDCSMGSRHDLIRLAWTSDGVKLFLYFERRSTSSSRDPTAKPGSSASSRTPSSTSTAAA